MGKGGLSWLSNLVGDVTDGIQQNTANRFIERAKKRGLPQKVKDRSLTRQPLIKNLSIV